jgi:hypothetical protein
MRGSPFAFRCSRRANSGSLFAFRDSRLYWQQERRAKSE